MSGHSYQIYRSENGMESEVSRNSQYTNFYDKNAQSDLYQQMQGTKYGHPCCYMFWSFIINLNKISLKVCKIWVHHCFAKHSVEKINA